jgi:hypothetical protein
MTIFSYQYSAAPHTLLKLLLAPDFVQSQRESLGERELRVDVDKRDSAATVVCTRLIETELPGFARKIFNPVNKVIETRHWRWTDDRIDGRFEVDVQGAPSRIEGSIKISPSSTGATYRVDFEVTAKVPLIRKKLEAYITEITLAGMQDEHDFNRRFLEGAERPTSGD